MLRIGKLKPYIFQNKLITNDTLRMIVKTNAMYLNTFPLIFIDLYKILS
jgi:hypothetical protein